MKRIIRVENEQDRLDAFVSEKIPSVSRSKIRRLIEAGNIIVNGRLAKPSRKLFPGEQVAVDIPEDAAISVRPQKIPFGIIYEDESIIVANKPANMVTHPAENIFEGTLVNALLGYTRKLSTVNGPMRRGIIHRLDKDTTGVLIIARTDEAHLKLAGQIASRQIKRIYRALVMGSVEPDSGEINAPLGRHEKNRVKMSIRFINGREAVTLYESLEKISVGNESFSHLRISLKTGRTHQIREHFASVGHPVCGDPRYGRKSPHISITRQALHAEEIGFVHPSSGKAVSFKAPLPEDFERQLKELKEYSCHRR